MKHTRLPALVLAALLLAGCAPSVPAPGSASAGTPPPDVSHSSPPAPPSVQVDWDRLEDRVPLQPDLDGGRWYDGYTDRLIPGEDYGPLIPYMGSAVRATNVWMDEAGEEFRFESPWLWPFYGLMTLEGKVVTDPVFTNVYPASYYHQREVIYLPALILAGAREEWRDYANGQRYAVAARDGSWCTDFEFWNYTARGEELLLVGPAGITRIHTADGSRRDWSWASLGLEDIYPHRMVEEMIWGMGFFWLDQGVYLYYEPSDSWEEAVAHVFQPDTGEVIRMTNAQWSEIQDQWYDQRRGEEPDFSIGGNDQVTMTLGEERYTLIMEGAIYDMNVQRIGDLCVITRYQGERTNWLFRLSDQTLMMKGDYYMDLIPDQAGGSPGLMVQEEGGPRTVYTPGLEPLMTEYDLSASLYGDRLSLWAEDQFFGCWDLEKEAWIFYRNLGIGD